VENAGRLVPNLGTGIKRGFIMITFRVIADVKEDHRVILTLPPEVPVGQAEIVVTIARQNGQGTKQARSSLAEWADENAEHWGNQLSSTDVEGFTGRRF
jgi:hypothetical protein